MKRAALYIRVSTDEQARHGLSLGEQRADLTNFAKVKGYAVYDLYADEGNTARKAISKRKELQRLLTDVRAGHIDIIVFKCLDRWFRNIRDYYAVQSILDEHHVEWECSQEDYKTTTTNGRLMLNLKLSIAQNESDQTSDRLRYINDGKMKRRECLTGKHPYGYKIEDKHLVIVPEEAAAVRFCFDYVLGGNSIHSTAKALFDKLGIALQQKRVWRMLRNEFYAGRRYGFDDYCPPIIPPAIFDRLQGILSRNKRPPKYDAVYLFSGKLTCPSCGNILLAHKMYRIRRDGTVSPPGYMCGKNRITGAPGECSFSGHVNEEKLEKYLVENLSRLLDEYATGIRAKAAAQIDYKSKIAATEKKLTRLKELYVDGLITKDEYLEDHAKHKATIDEYTRAMATVVTIPPQVQEILDLDDFPAMYNSLTKANRKALWQRLIDKIKISCPPKSSRFYTYYYQVFFY